MLVAAAKETGVRPTRFGGSIKTTCSLSDPINRLLHHFEIGHCKRLLRERQERVVDIVNHIHGSGLPLGHPVRIGETCYSYRHHRLFPLLLEVALIESISTPEPHHHRC